MEKKNRNIFNFEKLLVYQKILDYIDFVYMITEKFPKEERYNLTDQFRRASCSMTLNLGEGSAGTTKEFKNFIRISFRSLNECVVCATVSQRRKYITHEEDENVRERLQEITRMLSGLRNSLPSK